MKRLFLLFFLSFLCLASAQAAHKQIGTVCSGDSNSTDWDSIAQCNGTTFVKAPLALGKVSAPPYASTTCDAAKEGTIQYVSGTGFQGCDGSNWVSLGGGSTGPVPVGAIIAWPVATDPEDMANWLECNGQTITDAAYPKLYALVGSKVPDLRGLFLRGLGSQSFSQNNGSTIGTTSTTHTSGLLGAIQGDALRNITGGFVQWKGAEGAASAGAFTNTYTYTDSNGSGHIVNGTTDGRRDYYFDASRVVSTANEIRPVNTAVRYFIRAR